ncbi:MULTISPECIES: SH3 domain-containing protein [unclassified Ruegeria]|uniref:SH3 domain-containing protein n=1 Tax=unclassified Ruegeria TaxID=2625375 RepID=UPI0014928BAF|nr:SH3 domain-containing protein [Ruegeria sp. HKCCD5849]NOD51988.1 SH3 domain-containing protein [Ruegeria sp. HKCCD5851]NOD66646.1 SH3 domain-containing protein [Ruegeria sp. HKCCD7303]
MIAWLGNSQKESSPPRSQPSASVQADQAVYLYVTGNRVNQRAGPGTNHRKLGQLNRGARVRHVSDASGWTEIVSSLGSGWMSSEYLSRSSPPVEKKPSKATSRTIAAPTTREIQAARKAIISQSIAAYPGSCPCPYNIDRAGRRCGKRSAWSKPGGYSPICYDSDVSEQRLKSYLARRRGASN